MSEQGILLGALAAGTVFKLGALQWIGAKRKKKFVYVGTVSALNVYPVKSCRGYTVDCAGCTMTGLNDKGVTDRYWMIVDKNGGFITQRQEGSMALIESRKVGNEIELSAPGVTSFRLEATNVEKDAKTSICRVWDDHIKAVDCGEKAAAWISKYLNKEGCRIVRYVPGITSRPIKPKKDYETLSRPDDQASFGDYSPYFLLSQGSLDDLNSRLDEKLTMMSFRPGIVVDGPTAYDEDNWMEIRIGETAVLRFIDQCSRCNLTTVNPFTGLRNPEQEPLKTLRTYRLNFKKYKNSPLFGSYLALEEPGSIQVGDPVFALRFP